MKSKNITMLAGFIGALGWYIWKYDEKSKKNLKRKIRFSIVDAKYNFKKGLMMGKLLPHIVIKKMHKCINR